MSKTSTIRAREEICDVLSTDSFAIYKLHNHIFFPTNLTSVYMACQELSTEIPLFFWPCEPTNSSTSCTSCFLLKCSNLSCTTGKRTLDILNPSDFSKHHIPEAILVVFIFSYPADELLGCSRLCLRALELASDI